MLYWLSLLSLQLHSEDRNLLFKMLYYRFLSNFPVNSNVSFIMYYIWS